jgi:hypothetical protein
MNKSILFIILCALICGVNAQTLPNYWNLNGNSGTSASNFLGTMDKNGKDLSFGTAYIGFNATRNNGSWTLTGKRSRAIYCQKSTPPQYVFCSRS